MKQRLKVMFYLKKNEMRSDETYPVMGRIWVDKSMVQFSCKLTVPLDLWDTKSGRALGKGKLAVSLNRELDKINVSICSHFRELSARVGVDSGVGLVTAEQLKQAFQGMASSKICLLEFFARHNEAFARRVGVDRAACTHVHYIFSFDHLSRFVQKKYNLSDIPFASLDLDFITKFDFYLKVEQKLMPNTVLEKVAHLRRMVKYAIVEDIIEHDPFSTYSPERPRAKSRHLTRSELDKFMTTPLNHDYLYFSRDMFVFACFCGLSFQDLCNLTHRNIVRADDGVLWIETARQKTGTPCHIPLLDTALKILDKYKGMGKNGKLFPMACNSGMNRHLKAIAKICGIDRRMYFHMARHTFASEICIAGGVPIETVSQMLGHRDIRSTQIYAKTTKEKIQEDVNLLETRIKDKYQLVSNLK